MIRPIIGRLLYTERKLTVALYDSSNALYSGLVKAIAQL